jgi:hypothetical protein
MPKLLLLEWNSIPMIQTGRKGFTTCYIDTIYIFVAAPFKPGSTLLSGSATPLKLT